MIAKILFLISITQIVLSDSRISTESPTDLGNLNLTKVDKYKYLSSGLHFTYASGKSQKTTMVPNINSNEILIGLKEDASGDAIDFGVLCKGLSENKCEVTGADTTVSFQGKKINVKKGQTVCPITTSEFSSKSDIYLQTKFIVKQTDPSNSNLPYDTKSGVFGIGPGSLAYKYFIDAYKSSESS